MFGVLLMTLEDFETGLQQAFEFGVVRRRNEQGFERPVHCLVVSHFIGNISLVVCRAAELRQFGLLVGGLLRQCSTGIVIRRRDIELFHQIERLFVHGLMVTHHVLREGDNFLVLRLR